MRDVNSYISAVSSGNVNGTLVKLFSRQSTIPSAQRQGWGQRLFPPHSIGACSVKPTSCKKRRHEIKLRETNELFMQMQAIVVNDDDTEKNDTAATVEEVNTKVDSHYRPSNVYFMHEKKNLPEHLNSWSCKSATFCPFNWLGEWQRVYGANRGALRRNFESHDKWQSHANGLSESRRARSRGILENISRGSVVKLLLFNVRISSSWRFLTACSSMQTIWLWSNWRLRNAETPLNIRFEIAPISLFDKSLRDTKRE